MDKQHDGLLKTGAQMVTDPFEADWKNEDELTKIFNYVKKKNNLKKKFKKKKYIIKKKKNLKKKKN
jgi:hypothetical protein